MVVGGGGADALMNDTDVTKRTTTMQSVRTPRSPPIRRCIERHLGDIRSRSECGNLYLLMLWSERSMPCIELYIRLYQRTSIPTPQTDTQHLSPLELEFLIPSRETPLLEKLLESSTTMVRKRIPTPASMARCRIVGVVAVIVPLSEL